MKQTAYLKVAVALVVLTCILGIGNFFHDMNGGSFDFSETEMRVVVSGSMDGEPREEYDIRTIPVGSMVFIQKVPEGPYANDFYSSLRIGDVVTFNYKNPATREIMVVTHRIIDISNQGGDMRFTMAGDSILDDPTNSSKQVIYSSSGDMIGKVTGVSEGLGDITVFISSAHGKAVLIGVFAALLAIIWVGPMIFRHFNRSVDDKKDSNKECD